jgi:hypothetical protein
MNAPVLEDGSTTGGEQGGALVVSSRLDRGRKVA